MWTGHTDGQPGSGAAAEARAQRGHNAAAFPEQIETSVASQHLAARRERVAQRCECSRAPLCAHLLRHPEGRADDWAPQAYIAARAGVAAKASLPSKTLKGMALLMSNS